MPCATIDIMNIKTILNIALFLLLLLTCFALAAEIFQTTARGAQYKDLKSGTGKMVEIGDVVTMHFVGWIDNKGVKGKEIYNTRQQHKPVSFVVGTDKVMPGWNEGVIGMQTGGKRLLRVPPALGYGGRSVEDVIPANAGLMFVIDVMAVEKQ